MGNLEEKLTESELRKKAYSIALKLKNSGLDAEVIYARIEKQGIPEEMAMEVVKDILIERKRDIVQQTQPVYHFSLLRVGVGVAAALISALAFPGLVFIPVGLILGGLIFALLAKKKMNE
jgi:hypothetical protein